MQEKEKCPATCWLRKLLENFAIKLPHFMENMNEFNHNHCHPLLPLLPYITPTIATMWVIHGDCHLLLHLLIVVSLAKGQTIFFFVFSLFF
jgi:hypothetical protein